MENKPKDLAYYLTLFKLEGHETWRAALHSSKTAFDEEWIKTGGGPHGKKSKITERQVLRIDRLTGSFSA